MGSRTSGSSSGSSVSSISVDSDRTDNDHHDAISKSAFSHKEYAKVATKSEKNTACKDYKVLVSLTHNWKNGECWAFVFGD